MMKSILSRPAPSAVLAHCEIAPKPSLHHIFVLSVAQCSSSLNYYMSLKNSSIPQDSTQRIRVGKRREASPTGDDAAKRSMNMAEAFEHEKAMAQSYREKNQRNIVKCKFLYNKLTTLGNLEGVPEMIASEVSELDEKIKELEGLLTAKRQLQMRKLRRKVSSFLQQISFDILPQDFEKLEDQVELILFLVDIFEEKFNEMTSQRKEIDDIIARLERENTTDPVADANQLKKDNAELKKENERLLAKLVSYESDYQRMKEDRRDYDVPRDSAAIEDNATKSLQIQRQAKRIEDLQAETADIKAKLKLLQGDLQRSRREQARLKQRFRVMEGQKDQRIKMLQEALNKG